MIRTLTGEMLEKVLGDAAARMRGGSPVLNRSQMAVHSWPQRWPSSACGFPGAVAMQAFCVAPTICVVGPDQDVAVYHNGRFVAHVLNPGGGFYAGFENRNLPGASDRDWWESVDLSGTASILGDGEPS